MDNQNLNSFSDDLFNRKSIAENLTKIIESKNKPMVISLDSDWGTGKTTFVTMWKDLLDNDENSNFKTLYFNAWENDYIKDPLLAIFSEIEAQIKEDDPILKQQFDKVKSRFSPFVKLATTTGIKMLTRGTLDLDKIDLGETTEDELVSLAEKLGDLAIQEVSASKNVRFELKKEMSKYQEDSGKKIIFFIDELDRCRPSFAIELLEVIKHLFDIDNFIFIISIDKEQLSHSVSTIYGQNMDTIGYLRRFFDLDYKLPRIDTKKYIDIKNSIIFKDYVNIEYLEVFLKEFFTIEKFSLRDVDKAYYYIELLLPLVPEFTNSSKRYKNIYLMVISYIYSALIMAKIKKPIVYKQIIDGTYKLDEVIKNFIIPDFSNYINNIVGYSPKKLQSIINTLLKSYLNTNLVALSTDNLHYLESEDFLVGFKDEHGNYLDNFSYDLSELFSDSKSKIQSKLEFLEGF
ncbi:MAG: KAP family P-loop NTPase fold protein [Paraclostridium sp.]